MTFVQPLYAFLGLAAPTSGLAASFLVGGKAFINARVLHKLLVGLGGEIDQ